MSRVSNRIVLIIAFALGAGYALTLFGPSFILGRSVFWTQPHGDPATNMIGALYFVRDEWRFPLFYVPKLGFPEGANIVYTDSLPLLALMAKIVYKFSGEWFNYFGIWLFACFPLLAFFSALAIREAGAKDNVAILGGVLLALACPALLARSGHIALMGQFLIVWSIYLYFKLLNDPQSRSAMVQFCCVAALAMVLQAYFLILVVPFLFAALAQSVVEGRSSVARAALSAAVVAGVVGVVAWIAGIIGPDSPASTLWGFGYYSMNLLSPFLPPREHLPEPLARLVTWDGNGYTWDTTGGQYEGYNYLGAGLVILAAVQVAFSWRFVGAVIRRHTFLLLALIGFTLYAASNRIFVGNWLIIDFPVPRLLASFTNTFRTSGRVFWPVYYILVVALVVATFERFSPRVARVLIIGAVIVQLADTQVLRNHLTAAVAQGFHQELQKADWESLLAAHRDLRQYPSFQCGGWAGKWPDNNSNMELLLLAAQLNKPTNSTYLGRPNRDCASELAEGLKFDLRPDELYVFGNSFPIRRIATLPNFKELCREFKYGIVCSTKWSTDPALASLSSFQTISHSWAPEYVLGTLLKFSTGGNGEAYLMTGWSVMEPWGTWSIGHESEIALQLSSEPGGDLRLNVKANAFVHARRLATQIAVFVNNKQVALWEYTAGEGTKDYSADIAKELVPASRYLIIKFVSPTVDSPKEAGVSEDPRVLSLGLIDLTVSMSASPQK